MVAVSEMDVEPVIWAAGLPTVRLHTAVRFLLLVDCSWLVS
jgi:hypothetical protein